MGELPDQRIYGLFIAMDQTVMGEWDHEEEGVGRRYLTAFRTQRGQPRSSNFARAVVRAENGVLQATWNSSVPAVAKLEHSPGSFRPPTYRKMYEERSTMEKSKTYRMKKLPQHGASSPPKSPVGSVGGDIVEVPGRLWSYASHVE